MVSDPDLIRYACIAHNDSTVLAEFNSADSSVQDLALQCLRQAPSLHAIFSHSCGNQAYTFLLDDDPFVYFGIFDPNMPKPDRIQFLGRLKEALHHLVKGNNNHPHHKFTSHCFQGDFHPIFHKLMSKSIDSDALNALPNGNASVLVSVSGSVPGSSKSRKVFSVPLLTSSKIGKGFKKKRLSGQNIAEIKEGLVNGKFDSLGGVNNDGGHVGEVKSREIICQNGVCLIDGGGGGGGHGGKQKAKKIWRRHVWIVLVLDLAVCLILFGIWLFVCRGFQCIEG